MLKSKGDVIKVSKISTEHSDTEKHKHEPKEKQMSKVTVFILMLAFGIHEIFEGIAFGLMESTSVAV